MAPWTLAELAQAAGAAPPAAAPASRPVAALTTDSRRVPADSLFVALRGEQFDGHDFAAAAVAAGAVALLVDAAVAAHLPAPAVPVLVVADTLQALGDIAQHARRRMGRPVAAITGSNGKTTTKELLAAALGSRGPVHRTQGNLNNLIGLPLTLLAWPDSAWAAVCELGMNRPGEIDRLARIAAPEVGVVTCVAEAHLGGPGLGSLAAIRAAKCELFAALPAASVGVALMDDDALFAAARAACGGRRLLGFGRHERAEVRLVQARLDGSSLACRVQAAGAPLDFALPLLGQHNAVNACAALAAALALGVPPAAAAEGLTQVQVPGARLRATALAAPAVLLVDDSYNANPGSMQAAFAAVAELARGRRCLAALGDMLELGAEAAALHERVGAAAAAAGFAVVHALGPLAAATAKGAEGGGAQGRAHAEPDALLAALRGQLRDGDVLLVKGSRGMRMERISTALLGSATKGL